MNSSEIITGEKLQELSMIYLGTESEFNSNPRIQMKRDKHININSIVSPFQNPRIVFFYSHQINKVADIIQFFMNPVILISHNSDHNIVESRESLKILETPNVIKWYSQNICFYHPKLILAPIGFANSMWSHGNLSIFDNSLFIKTLHQKTNRISFNFNIYTNICIRENCYNILIKHLPFLPNIDPIENLKRLSSYEFCISPEGNGVDCHRIWEALYLKVVPIVLQSPFTKTLLRNNIPLVVLNSWEEFERIEPTLSYQSYDFSVIDREFTMSKMMDKIITKEEN
jgi:hypothetical protein